MNTDMHADRFENRLLTAILDDFDNLAGAESAAGSGAGRLGRGPRRAGSGLSRRRGAFTLLAGTMAVGAAAAGVAVVASGGGHAVVPPRAAIPAHLSAAYVMDHVKAAVRASAASDIQYDLQRAPNSQTGVVEHVAEWSWAASGREITLSQVLGASGKPALSYLMTVTTSKTVTITINYADHTWSTTTYPWGHTTPRNTPGPKPQTLAQVADTLHNAIKAGSMTDAGAAEVDGQRSIHLMQGSTKTGEINLWVNPETYLPIREIDTAPGVSETSDRAIQTDTKWLPDTAANLKLLTPAGAIPAGFTQVSNAGAGN